MTTPSLGVQDTWIIGFGLDMPSANGWQWRFLNGASQQLRLEVIAGGGGFNIRVMRGAVEVAVTTANFAFNVWHYFEFKVTLTNTGSFELRQNEQNVLSDAGPVDLQDLGSSGADGHSWFYQTSGQVDMDDIYINDDQGTEGNTDFLGDSVAFNLLPTSDQAVQWTPVPSSPTTNFDKVDDAPTVTDDATYVETNTNTDSDFYEFENTPATGVGTIHAVKVSYDGRMESAGSSTISAKFKNSGGSIGDGDDFVFNSTSFLIQPVIFNEEPVGATAWTASDIDGGRFGMERVS